MIFALYSPLGLSYFSFFPFSRFGFLEDRLAFVFNYYFFPFLLLGETLLWAFQSVPATNAR